MPPRDTRPLPRRVGAVVPDLYFATRIAATARAAGVELELLPAPRAAEWVRQAPPAVMLIDLNAPGAVELVAALKTVAPTLPVVGFYSHVETTLKTGALAAGADAVLPRSQFVARLAVLLTRGVEAVRTPAPGDFTS